MIAAGTGATLDQLRLTQQRLAMVRIGRPVDRTTIRVDLEVLAAEQRWMQRQGGYCASLETARKVLVDQLNGRAVDTHSSIQAVRAIGAQIAIRERMACMSAQERMALDVMTAKDA